MHRLVVGVLMTLTACASPEAAAPLERVVVAPDGRSFVLAESGAPFVPWGFNYDHDRDVRLLEEYWVDGWDDVVGDLGEIRALGANVVRLHLQVAAFMTGPDTADEAALVRLRDLATVAARQGLRLDITGLAAYRGAADPPWYVALPEAARWEVQARFWGAVAERLAGDPAVFAYDLMNEPLVPTDVRTDWTPGEFGGLSFVQCLVLELGARDPAAVAHAWRMAMKAAIRAHDPDVLITVGQFPFTTQPGFTPAEVAADLDYLSVHLYPETGKMDASLGVLAAFAAAGRPVVVEEIGALNCSAEELGQFITDSRAYATGWIGFYWGQTPTELRAQNDIPAALLLAWLDLFVGLTPTIVGR